MRALIATLLICLSACADEPVSPEAGIEDDALSGPMDAQRAPDGVPIATPAELAGEYRVAGIDSRPLDADFGIAVSITGETISYGSDCHGTVWTYRLSNGRLQTRRDARRKQAADAEGSAPNCPEALPEEYGAIDRAVGAATRVKRTQANGILLSGGSHDVLLFSQ